MNCIDDDKFASVRSFLAREIDTAKAVEIFPTVQSAGLQVLFAARGFYMLGVQAAVQDTPVDIVDGDEWHRFVVKRSPHLYHSTKAIIAKLRRGIVRIGLA